MQFKPIAFVAAAALFLAVSPARAGDCCDQAKMPCCQEETMPCCDHKTHAEPVTFFAFDTQLEPPAAVPAARQLIEVWFQRPVKVGEAILQGRYVIEHDTDRMARGEPCTHIYAYGNQKDPVVTFHCLHLERDRAGQNTVVLYTAADGLQRLLEFQFNGETAAHGNPSVR